MPIAHVGDIDIAYETHGHGPALLAIMGLTGDRHHWRGFPERFSRTHRVITFDNRGVGETSAPRGAYSVKQMAEDSLGLLDHLEVKRASVLGVSMGGMIAQELGLLAPDRIEKLVLGCTSFGGAGALPSHPDVQLAFQSVGKDGPEASIRRLLATNFSPRYREEHADVIEELVRYGLTHRMTPIGFQGQLSAIASHDTASRLSQLHAPVLLLSGDLDLLIPHENSKLLAALLPDARIVTLPGVGHMWWIEGADAGEAAVRAFLG